MIFGKIEWNGLMEHTILLCELMLVWSVLWSLAYWDFLNNSPLPSGHLPWIIFPPQLPPRTVPNFLSGSCLRVIVMGVYCLGWELSGSWYWGQGTFGIPPPLPSSLVKSCVGHWLWSWQLPYGVKKWRNDASYLVDLYFTQNAQMLNLYGSALLRWYQICGTWDVTVSLFY